MEPFVTREYKTVTACDTYILDEFVNESINKGWEPYGSPSATITVSPEGEFLWAEYRQAMVR